MHNTCPVRLLVNLDLKRYSLKSIAITTNTFLLTDIPNDYDFEEVFTRQVDALAEKGDILVGITAGSTSQNIITCKPCHYSHIFHRQSY